MHQSFCDLKVEISILGKAEGQSQTREDVHHVTRGELHAKQ